MANTKTNRKPAAKTPRSEEMVTLTSRNGHGISTSRNQMPAYKAEAMRRVAPTIVYGD